MPQLGARAKRTAARGLADSSASLSVVEKETGSSSEKVRDAAVLYADISGFTTLSERMDPEDLTDTIDACFASIERVVFEGGGRIERFIGDCAVATFGLSVALPDAPFLALNAAIAIRSAVAGVRRERRLPTVIDVHIGVHSGPVPVASVRAGSELEMAGANSTFGLAMRLQSAARGGEIYVSPAIRSRTLDHFEYRTAPPLELEPGGTTITPYELLTREPRTRDARPGDSVPAGTATRDNSGERRQATVLFADISGFTALAERSDPEDLAEIVNECFRTIERIVVERGGCVDKFIGDCAMALFGVPLALEDAARQAINAAIRIREAIVGLNERRRLPAPLDVHIGVNSGLVLAGEVGGDERYDYTVMGATVNLASRLQSAAASGRIYVGPATYALTRHHFEYRAGKPLRLKGISGLTTPYELLSRQERIHRTGIASTSSDLALPMVGREKELAAIVGRFERVKSGVGSIVSVVAGNGLGKSRLIAEVERSPAAFGVSLFEARSVSSGGSLSYHPFIDLLENWAGIRRDRPAEQAMNALRAAVASVGPTDADDVVAAAATLLGLDLDERERQCLEGISGEALEKLTHRSMRKLFEAIAHHTPVAFVFEDLHWADQSSVALLRALLPVVESAPILFLLVARPGYEDSADRILEFVGANLSLFHTPIRLDVLTGPLCDALIDNLLGTDDVPVPARELVQRHGEGNPFYVEEVVRTLLDEGALVRRKGRIVATDKLRTLVLPTSIGEVLMARVDLLGGAAREVLRIGSVIGRRFERRLLEEIAPSDLDIDAGLAELAEKHFVDEAVSHRTGAHRRASLSAEVVYRFRHALIQETVYGALLKRARVELHSACAEAIERAFADRLEDAYGMLAYHYTRAARPEKAELYLIRAGEQAAATAASAEALQYFRLAYDVYLEQSGDSAEPRKKAMLEKNIALALLNTGHLAECVDHFNAALELYGQWVPRSKFALWTKLVPDLLSVMLHLYVRRRHDGPRRDHSDEHEMFGCYYNRCRAVNIIDARRGFFDNLAAMRYLSHVDPRMIEHACGMYASTGAFFAFAGLSARTGRRFLDVARGLRKADNSGDAFVYRAMSSVVDFHAGPWPIGETLDESLLEQGLRRGLLWDADVYLGMLCERFIRQGRFDEAEQCIAKLVDLRQAFGYDFARSNELAMRAYLYLERRDLGRARRAMEEYYEFRHEDTLRVFALSGLVRIALLEGRLDEAGARLADAETLVKRSGRVPPFYLGAHYTSRAAYNAALLAAMPSRSTERVAVSSARAAVRCGDQIVREGAESLRIAARVLWLCGKRSRAMKTWQAAIDRAVTLSMAPERARIFADLSRCLKDVSGAGGAFAGEGPESWSARARAEFERLDLLWDLGQLDGRGDGSSFSGLAQRISA